MNATKTAAEERHGELDINTLKKYITFCRSLVSFSSDAFSYVHIRVVIVQLYLGRSIAPVCRR